MSVSVVIPHRNSGALLDRCLDALDAASGVGETIVVDEGSTDGSAERAAARSGVEVLSSPGAGFAVAANAGIRAATGDRLLLLGSDAFVRGDTVERLDRRLDGHPRLAACGAALVDGDGRRAKTHASLLTLRRALGDAVGFRPSLRQDGRGLALVEAVFPNCLLVRREALEAVGGFDERFAFYYEDMDLCRRLRDAGWKLGVDWDAEAVHLGGGSTSGRGPQRWFRQYHASRLVYLRKHHPRAWLLYLTLWAPRALLHAVSWRVRAGFAALRGDAAGARHAREWASALARSALPL